jgi:hypothetical protein
VLNNSLIHISKASRAALAERAIGSPSNGCPDMRLNSMTSRPSAATLNRAISPIKPSLISIRLDSAIHHARRRAQVTPKAASVGLAKNLCVPAVGE